MERKKQSLSGIVGVVPRLVGCSVGAAAARAKRILFGRAEETTTPAAECTPDRPKKRTRRSAGNRQKKKHGKASPKCAAGKKR